MGCRIRTRALKRLSTCKITPADPAIMGTRNLLKKPFFPYVVPGKTELMELLATDNA